MKELMLLIVVLLGSGGAAQAETGSADASDTGREVSLTGNPVQGGILFGKAPRGAQVMVNQLPLPVAGDGQFVVGIGRDEAGPLELIVITDRGRHAQSIDVVPRSFDIERIDGLPEQMVTPDPAVAERIAREAAAVAAARERRDDRTDFQGGFVWPAKGRLSGFYGSQRILNGEPRTPHYGVDVAAPTGDPVSAPAAGIITFAEPNLYFSGGTVILDHGLGVSSTFLHLSRIDVAVGQQVRQGTRLGAIGATGRATGPHLDWRMNVGSVRVDPQVLMGTQQPE